MLSSFTLAFFEDTGWYNANYSEAEALIWGAGKGCGFLEEKCIDVDRGTTTFGADEGYFCTESAQESCTADRLSKGVCAMSKYTKELPEPFQYFPSDKMRGGSLGELDYCPYIQAYSNGDCSNGANDRRTTGQLSWRDLWKGQ